MGVVLLPFNTIDAGVRQRPKYCKRYQGCPEGLSQLALNARTRVSGTDRGRRIFSSRSGRPRCIAGSDGGAGKRKTWHSLDGRGSTDAESLLVTPVTYLSTLFFSSFTQLSRAPLRKQLSSSKTWTFSLLAQHSGAICAMSQTRSLCATDFGCAVNILAILPWFTFLFTLAAAVVSFRVSPHAHKNGFASKAAHTSITVLKLLPEEPPPSALAKLLEKIVGMASAIAHPRWHCER
ncbi:hypothetical protein B0H13DRAFT_1923619 [Mycena leptocephala]|nr:hypothetical protein B0H13DRAFT_1923619 [Mycena leptocephala]